MSAITTAVALLAITALTVWTLGSVLLRSAGALGVTAGLMLGATGTAAGLVIAVAGALAWLGGHTLYATRHHTYRSPLARRLYTQTPMRRLDVTRGWVIPTSWPTTPKQTRRPAPSTDTTGRERRA
ncbi:hypothetical protein NBH00_18530 [Paraconexibacter antarcticus]|uniref:Uncharacterized protein n=1 Tax=Paraconexibacter antarcticus TaxID=2949664 RepID=A0ABY5DRY6_9ACTN|nr:hypothetical protein [Paraconexibacter antarcticus]UTI63339.1 hypothetical protein NBH00_18530 [Paraconexibacter antarcticus]